MSGRLRILFEDEHCLAVFKPAGQFTQGDWAPPGETTLEQDVRVHLAPASPAEAYVGIVHRLDRPVSGVLLWAKTPKAARRLAAQFEKRQVVKEYWAIVESPSDEAPIATGQEGGGLPKLGETWVHWLTRADASGVVHAVPAGTPGAREARTRCVVDEAARLPAGLRRLRLWPETGRTHQLRVQTAAAGLPILGDAAYGAKRPFTPGIALHAWSLQARHPTSSTPMVLTAPPPPSWEAQGVGGEG